MSSKRTFLKQAVAAVAVGSVMQWESALAFARAAGPGWAFDAVVFNDRYSDARVFASALAPRAVRVLPMEGDAGVLWYGTLRQVVRKDGVRIAGMSTHTDLFILETLARDAGLRVHYRGRHDCAASLTLTHRICAGHSSRQLARTLEVSGCDWPAALAGAMPSETGASASASATVSDEVFVCSATKRSHDHPGSLVSWVLA